MNLGRLRVLARIVEVSERTFAQVPGLFGPIYTGPLRYTSYFLHVEGKPNHHQPQDITGRTQRL